MIFIPDKTRFLIVLKFGSAVQSIARTRVRKCHLKYRICESTVSDNLKGGGSLRETFYIGRVILGEYYYLHINYYKSRTFINSAYLFEWLKQKILGEKNFYINPIKRFYLKNRLFGLYKINLYLYIYYYINLLLCKL